MIIRGKRPDANFYILDKKISEDKSLSWAARGLLIFLLGKPDDWSVSTQNLINETAKSGKPIGRDGVRALINELILSGYVVRMQRKGELGRMDGFDYFVSETANPATANPATANPATANHPLIRTETSSSNDLKVNNEKERGENSFDPIRMDLPDCVLKSLWCEWIAYRKEIKLKTSERTAKSQLKFLEKNGADANEIIEQSIRNGWKGLFDLKNKPQGNAKPSAKPSYDDGKKRDYGTEIGLL